MKNYAHDDSIHWLLVKKFCVCKIFWMKHWMVLYGDGLSKLSLKYEFWSTKHT